LSNRTDDTDVSSAESTLVRSGAAIYAGAAAIGALETAVRGAAAYSPVPWTIALLMAPAILVFGPRVPRSALAALGPIGVVLVAMVVAHSPGASDAAILYAWPVLWVACFFGVRETAPTVLAVFVAHALALLALPDGSLDRWCAVATSVVIVATVVRVLAARNERLVARLRAELRIDPLTGLLNRRGLSERSESEIARSRREDQPLAVVALDVDHFKRINDTHGHDAGDRALIELAAVLREQTRGSDIVARTGGEEFLVVLPNADMHAATEFAERLRAAVEANGRMTISAGVAASSRPETIFALTDAADEALYAAKRAGRNRVIGAPSTGVASVGAAEGARGSVD
jgi:diguanylate cyclase (GGDEF)-like protein